MSEDDRNLLYYLEKWVNKMKKELRFILAFLCELWHWVN